MVWSVRIMSILSSLFYQLIRLQLIVSMLYECVASLMCSNPLRFKQNHAVPAKYSCALLFEKWLWVYLLFSKCCLWSYTAEKIEFNQWVYVNAKFQLLYGTWDFGMSFMVQDFFRIKTVLNQLACLFFFFFISFFFSCAVVGMCSWLGCKCGAHKLELISM